LRFFFFPGRVRVSSRVTRKNAARSVKRVSAERRYISARNDAAGCGRRLIGADGKISSVRNSLPGKGDRRVRRPSALTSFFCDRPVRDAARVTSRLPHGAAITRRRALLLLRDAGARCLSIIALRFASLRLRTGLARYSAAISPRCPSHTRPQF